MRACRAAAFSCFLALAFLCVGASIGSTPPAGMRATRGSVHSLVAIANCETTTMPAPMVSLVSPLAADRAVPRRLHEAAGLPFLEIFVDTDVEECARRDPKGLYAKARAAQIEGFTGVDAPYEPPSAAFRRRWAPAARDDRSRVGKPDPGPRLTQPQGPANATRRLRAASLSSRTAVRRSRSKRPMT